MPGNRIIIGKVVDTDLAQGIKNLRVEAWGNLYSDIFWKRLFLIKHRKTLLGATTTTASGDFKITIGELVLAKLSGSKIWFKVFSPEGHIIADTEDSVAWSPDTSQTIKISVEWDGSTGTPVSELELTGNDGKVRISFDANTASGRIGGQSVDGEFALFPGNVVDISNPQLATIYFLSRQGLITLGGNNVNGVLVLKKANGTEQVRLDASDGSGSFGGRNVDGRVLVYPHSASADAQGRLDPNDATIQLDGATGDILLANADCAEDFDMAVDETADVIPGHVMILDDEGRLALCRKCYDKRVAGVISGAGNYKPGIVLDRHKTEIKRMPLALVGKVFCWVDATNCSIDSGDLLTTSSIPGHAMKASDRDRAFGAVIGKALQPLRTDKGLIPILIALQ